MQLSAIRAIAAGTVALLLATAAHAQKAYGPGVTDTEVKIGQTEPFSGPASNYGIVAKIEAAYFDMINETGGVNGRKINLIAFDDALSPPKTVEQTRRLVESDDVLAIVGTFGTAANIGISKYLNAKKVPQLLAASASEKLNDPVNLPWTTTFFPPQQLEARLYAAWLLKNMPNAKIGVLFQNDDFGKGYLEGLRAGLGEKASSMIVKEQSYDLLNPTVDSQVLTLQAAGADVLFHAALTKFSAQVLAKTNGLGWKPLQLIPASTASTLVTMDSVGGENAAGILTTQFLKDPNDPTWDDDDGMRRYKAFMAKWAPSFSAAESRSTMGYSIAEFFVHILKQCGDNLSRENLLKQATNVHEVQLSMFLPGVTLTVTPEDRNAFRKVQMSRYDGKRWVPIAGIVSAGAEP